MSKSYLCPFCGSPLSKAKFDSVARQHESLHAALAKAEAEAKRFRRLQAESKRLLSDQARKHREDLHKVREAAAATATAKAKKTMGSELRSKEKQLRIEQSRRASYERRIGAFAAKSREQAEEIRRLKEQIEKGITPQIEGLLEEKNLLKHLKAVFPNDRYEHTGKGGDIVHTVIHGDMEVGVIVYECKRVKVFQRAHLLQTAEARKKRGADYAILVTNVLPSKQTFFYVERDVIVLSPTGLVPVVHTARQSLISLHQLRASQADRQRAIRAVYDYLSGREYQNRINGIGAEMEDLQKEVADELRFHKKNWTKRFRIYNIIFSDVEAIDLRLRTLLVSGSKGSARQLPRPRQVPVFPKTPDLPEG